MQINADRANRGSFSLQMLLGALAGNGQKTGGTAKNAGGPLAAAIKITSTSRTQVVLQAEDFEKRDKSGLQPPAAPDAAFSNDGYWGIDKTAGRIADFVLQRAGDDEEKLRIGRDAIMQGFREAEKVWGGKLPDISYKTIEAAVAAIDDRLRELDAPLVDLVV